MKESILVVEDDSNIQELIVEFLSSEGYDVDFCNDGVEALEKFNKGHYDLLIIDVMMPNMDGYTLCKKIREISSVSIIFLTALNDEENQLKGFEFECDDYITKPFSFNVLIKRVEAVLRRNRKYLKFEDVTLNLKNYTVEIENKVVELTLKEFSILKYLIESYPKIITRENLLDEVWGYNYFGDARIVDAHIKNIRKKLNYSFIKTVKGVGYTLDGKI